jgi:hypothetical protein
VVGVVRLDRLGRSFKELLETVGDFKAPPPPANSSSTCSAQSPTSSDTSRHSPNTHWQLAANRIAVIQAEALPSSGLDAETWTASALSQRLPEPSSSFWTPLDPAYEGGSQGLRLQRIIH